MKPNSISAYDLPQRVASYDADMELMHPNRAEMVRIALEILPFPRGSSLRAIDLGVGTGYFTQRFLEWFPNSRVLAIDGARAMIDLARARLGVLASNVTFRLGDFQQRDQLGLGTWNADVVFSSYALHHLDRSQKRELIRWAVGLLRPGGWFLNADLVVADSVEAERRIQQIRVESIVARAQGADARFRDAAATRDFLDRMEAEEGDQPLTLLADLEILRRSGLRSASAFWLEYRELLSGGQK